MHIENLNLSFTAHGCTDKNPTGLQQCMDMLEQFFSIFSYNAVQKPVVDNNAVLVACLYTLTGYVLFLKIDDAGSFCLIPSGFYGGV